MGEWWARAACRDSFDLRFFGHDQDGARLEYCVECPVREECLDLRVQSKEKYGLWGGITGPDHRKRVRT